MESKPAPEKIAWRWIAAALVLGAFLAATLIVSVAQINQLPESSARAKPDAAPASSSVPPDTDVGNFAFGYVEFDQNPKAPGGVPGFDSWPPGSPPRR
jgi:hypothetical protein